MKTLFLVALLAFQGVTTSPQSSTVMGHITRGAAPTAAGILVGVRAAGTGMLIAIAETDEAGGYRFNLPPGRYHILAGLMSSPTFYPGSSDVLDAKAVTVVAGSVVTGIDFALVNPVDIRVRGRVVIEGGGSLPRDVAAFIGSALPAATGSPSPPALMRMISQKTLGGSRASTTVRADGSFELVLPAGDSQIFVQALPLGYYVQSIFAGTLDILRFPFAVSEAPLPEIVVTLTRTAPLSDPPTVTVRGRVNNVPSDATPRWVVLQAAPAGTIAFGAPSTIGEVPLQADGTFEVHGVPPGNYTIVPAQTGQSSTARATFTVPAEGLDGFEIAWAPPRPARGAPSVTAAPVFNVRGKVRTFPGAGLPTAIRLTPFAARQTKQQTTISADGSFEFSGVGQGSWNLRVGSEVLFNTLSLSVVKQDVVGIEINAPVELRGRVVMADGSTPTPVFQIQNEFAAGNSVGTPTVRTLPAQREFDIRSDGTFSVGVVPGQQRISVLGLPLSYSVKSIAYGAVDLSASPLSLTDIPTGEMLVTLERTNVPEGPPRFSFVYQYGHDTLQHPNVIDTARGTFTRDMVSDLSQTFNLRFDDAELKQIEDMLDAIDFWNAEKYPTVFTMPNPGPMGCGSTGRQPIFLLVRRRDVSKELTWMDQDSVCTPNQAGKDLRSLMSLIRGILEGKPEYQKLPRPAGGYID